MRNEEVGEHLHEIGDYLEIQGKEFKPQAYHTAASNIEALSKPIEVVHERGEPQDIDVAMEGEERTLIGRAFDRAEGIRDRIASVDVFEDVRLVGSFRRRRPTSAISTCSRPPVTRPQRWTRSAGSTTSRKSSRVARPNPP